MVKELLIDNHGLGHAVALTEKRQLKALLIDPKSLNDFYPPSCFLVVKIARRIKELGGYFINLPNKKEGLLLSKKLYSEGESIPVMAKIYTDREKVQRFSDKLKMETKYFIIEQGNGSISFSKNFLDTKLKIKIKSFVKAKLSKIGRDKSVIIRSSIQNELELNWQVALTTYLNSFQKLLNDFEMHENVSLGMLSREKALNFYRFEEDTKVIEREGIFDLMGLWDDIGKLLEKKFFFGNKSYLIIEQTSAFCAIDVNSGSDLKIRANQVNLEACDPIIYNVKLRGIGGKIIIDFLPCALETKIKIKEKIVSSLHAEGSSFRVLGWTKGNNFEIEGRRTQIPLNLIMKS